MMANSIRRFVLFVFAALAGGPFTGIALAQQDVQITSEAIIRTCAEIHHTPNVQAEAPTIRGDRDITLNCRLIVSGGFTIAQVAPGEVCQRLTGSPDWYRGMGTQVYCRAAGATPADSGPRSFTITQEDIARACQRTHHNPQATADPITTGPYGLELNCRLVNQNGVTLARVSPEDVCESKFGTREWISVLGGNTFLCKGTPIAKLPSDEFPNKPPGGGGGAGGGGPAAGAVNDVPLTPEAIAKGCQALHGAGAVGAPLTNAGYEPVINCKTPSGVVAHNPAEFCPHLSGTPGWYVTDYGRGTWLPGESASQNPRQHVCRGAGPLQFHAFADIGRYCRGRGHRYGNFGIGAEKPPACFDQPGAPRTVSMADVCRDVHRGDAYERRGMVYLCLPAGAPRRP